MSVLEKSAAKKSKLARKEKRRADISSNSVSVSRWFRQRKPLKKQRIWRDYNEMESKVEKEHLEEGEIEEIEGGGDGGKPPYKPEYQYSREELMRYSDHPLSRQRPVIKDPQIDSLLCWQKSPNWSSIKRFDTPTDRGDDSYKRRTNDPRERVRKEQEGIVLSPQRRSFNSGCFVTVAPNNVVRPPAESTKEGAVRRIGSGRIINRDWEFRDKENADDGYPYRSAVGPSPRERDDSGGMRQQFSGPLPPCPAGEALAKAPGTVRLGIVADNGRGSGDQGTGGQAHQREVNERGLRDLEMRKGGVSWNGWAGGGSGDLEVMDGEENSSKRFDLRRNYPGISAERELVRDVSRESLSREKDLRADPRVRDRERLMPRYSVDRRRFEAEEPEWFSGGPTSQHDTIELRGFEDASEGGARNKAKQISKNSSKPNSRDSKSNTGSRKSSSEEISVNKAGNGGTDKEVEQESPAASSSPKVEPPESQKSESDGVNSEETGRTENHDFLNLEDFLQLDNLPLLTNGGGGEGNQSSSRFTQWFRRDSPSDVNDTRRSSVQDELIKNIINDINEPTINIPNVRESDAYFAPISPAGTTSGNSLLEMLQNSHQQSEHHAKAPSIKDLEATGKVTSVEELEARMRQGAGQSPVTQSSQSHTKKGASNRKEEELIAFKKLLKQVAEGGVTTANDQMNRSTASSLYQMLNKPPEPSDMMGQAHQPNAAPQMHVPHDLVYKLLQVQEQQRQAQQQQQELNKLLFSSGRLVPPHVSGALSPLPPDLQMKVANSQPSAELLARPEAQAILQGLRQGEITPQHLVQQLQNPAMQPRHREVLASILKLHGNSPRPASPLVVPPDPTLIQQLMLQQQLRNPSPLPSVHNAFCPSSMIPPNPLGTSPITLTVQHAGLPHRVPSPRELMLHTQTIMQSALIKKKLEEQRENFRKRQEMQRAVSPNVVAGSKSPNLPSATTTTVTNINSPAGSALLNSVNNSNNNNINKIGSASSSGNSAAAAPTNATTTPAAATTTTTTTTTTIITTANTDTTTTATISTTSNNNYHSPSSSSSSINNNNNNNNNISNNNNNNLIVANNNNINTTSTTVTTVAAAAAAAARSSTTATKSPTPLAFTPTSVLRKMTADQQPTQAKDGDGNKISKYDLFQAKLQRQNELFKIQAAQSSRFLANNQLLGLRSPQQQWPIQKQAMQQQQQPLQQGRAIVKGNGNYAPAPLLGAGLVDLPYANNARGVYPQRSKLTMPTASLVQPNLYNSFPTPANRVPPNRGLAPQIGPLAQHNVNMNPALQHMLMSQNMTSAQQRNLFKPGIRNSFPQFLPPNGGDGDLSTSPTNSNQLAHWFSPELLAQAQAQTRSGKSDSTLNMVSVEELERLQQSSAPVIN